MYQKMILIGNLGRDPEMRYTPSGQAVTNFSMATNRKWTGNDGEKQEETCWFRGPRIYTRNDGSPGASFEVTAYRVVFLSSRSEDQAYQPTGDAPPVDNDDEDDIPF
jgi:single-strand DNA-binding protein